MFVLAINTAFPIISIFFFYHYIIAVLQFFYKVKMYYNMQKRVQH